jgi:hypothetical protein
LITKEIELVYRIMDKQIEQNKFIHCIDKSGIIIYIYPHVLRDGSYNKSNNKYVSVKIELNSKFHWLSVEDLFKKYKIEEG